jgi:SAM-dependent methyltransferase
MPTQETLEEYYRSYYDERDYYRKKNMKVTFDIPEKLAAHIFSNTYGSLRDMKIIRILDFGGGNGEISIRLAKRYITSGAEGVLLTVVDYTNEVFPLSDDKIKIAHYKTLAEVRNSRHEIVIASAIIEHIPSPLQTIIELFSILQRGGIFYARTPYVLPFLKIVRSLGVKFDFQYPGHVHDLGSRFWNNIFRKLPIEGEYEIIGSKPSIVETSFKDHFMRTLIAHFFKAPWYLLKGNYELVGGWEVFIKKK